MGVGGVGVEAGHLDADRYRRVYVQDGCCWWRVGAVESTPDHLL